jgi:hypothetical protein
VYRDDLTTLKDEWQVNIFVVIFRDLPCRSESLSQLHRPQESVCFCFVERSKIGFLDACFAFGCCRRPALSDDERSSSRTVVLIRLQARWFRDELMLRAGECDSHQHPPLLFDVPGTNPIHVAGLLLLWLGCSLSQAQWVIEHLEGYNACQASLRVSNECSGQCKCAVKCILIVSGT